MRALLVLLIACTHAAAPCELPAPGPSGPPFLWRVQRGTATLWLFGTIHNAGAGDVPPAALAALASAKRFASELGDVEPDKDKLRDLAVIRTGPGLDTLLPADDWYDLRDALRGKVKEDDLRRARPWYAMTRLMAVASPAPEPTMDVALANRAHDARLTVDHLESWAQQMQALADGVTVKDVQETLHTRKTIACDLAKLRASYLRGDAAEMTRLLVVHPDGPLLAARNARWLPLLTAYLDGDGAFVAVGLGHLLGDAGIVAALQSAGYSVERAP
jgi:uncharacterized protein YbaP (TraB family)